MTKEKQERGTRHAEHRNPKEESSEGSSMVRRGGPGRSMVRGDPYALAWRTGGPFTFMRRLSEQMDRLFDSVMGPGFTSRLERVFPQIETPVWAPRIEMFQREGNLVIRAELPGLNKEDVDVEVTEDEVILRGERKQEEEIREEGLYRSECQYGSFYRSIPLPAGVDASAANATFRKGVLEVTMPGPKLEEPPRHHIEIRTEAEESSTAEKKGEASGSGAQPAK